MNSSEKEKQNATNRHSCLCFEFILKNLYLANERIKMLKLSNISTINFIFKM